MSSSYSQVQNTKLILGAAGFGLVSGLAAIISIFIIGDTYGPPGSTAYQTYESFNRMMAILLALEACSLIAFYILYRGILEKTWQIAILIVIVAWFGMAIGTAAEFWISTDLPYGQNNMRNVAFSIFSMSGLIVGIGLFLIGVWILMRHSLNRYYGIIFFQFVELSPQAHLVWGTAIKNKCLYHKIC